MWLITIEAIPDPKEKPDDAKEFGGAFVNCWINFLLEDGAVELARFYIKKNGWIPINLTEENRWFEETDCDLDEQRQYFSEAKIDGASLVWYSYPIKPLENEDFFQNETTH